MNNIPRSPFATRLSGSAKETELRIRNIFQWQKQRPPLWAMILAALVILSCGGLVSCRARQPGPAIGMDVQYYDKSENYIEIPILIMPEGSQADQGIAAINEALAELKGEYARLLSALEDGTAPYMDSLVPFENHCLLYPTETERYLNLLFLREEFSTDLNTAHLTSLVYDKEEGQQVTLTDALALAGASEEELFSQLSAQFDGYINPDLYAYIQNPALEGFRMGADGQPIFYLTARMDDDPENDWLSGSDNVYIWSDGTFTRYDQHTLEPEPLVPAEECVRMDPPLWHQWYFESGEPEGGFYDPEALPADQQALLETLYETVSDQMHFVDYEGPHPLSEISSDLLNSYSQAGYTLGAAAFQDAFATYLVIGSVEDATGALTGPAYISSARGGVPHTASFMKDGDFHLLYSFNNMGQNYIYGASGVVRLAEGKLSWTWPVEGDILEEASQARAGYDAYWENHLALMSPGGVDVFGENPDFNPYVDSSVQWIPEHNETFWYTAEQDLPVGVMYQTRVWLEEFTRDERNPWDARNTSASWRILSLTPGEPRVHPVTGQAAYNLVARADNGRDLWLTAALRFDRELGKVVEVLDFAVGTQAELGLEEDTVSGMDSSEFYGLLYDALQAYYPGETVYFAVDQPDPPLEGQRRIDQVSLAGQGTSSGSLTEAYLVEQSVYLTHGETTDWLPMEPLYFLLTRGEDGSFQHALGLFPASGGVSAENILRLQDLEVCLYRDGWPTPVGPGNWPELFDPAVDGDPTIEVLEGWEPIYWPGDYWDRWSLEGITALRYYIAAEDRWSANTIDVTRDDLYTPRGIRVGSTRAEVLEAYPEIRDVPYWDYEGDYLWYNSTDFDFGASILFYFEHDRVSKILLIDMFD